MVLLGLAVVGFVFGLWLFKAGFVLLGCMYMALWLWNANRFAFWLMLPVDRSVSELPLAASTRAQRVVLAVICLAVACVSAVGVYIWYVSPVDWQAGLVFILFGMIVLPVTVTEIRLRRNIREPWSA